MARKSDTAVVADVSVESLPLEEAAAPAVVPEVIAPDIAPVVEAPAAVVVEQTPIAATAPAAVVTYNSDGLYCALGLFGQRLQTEAERVVAEVMSKIDGKFHSPELVAKVQEATHKLAIVSAGRIGASPEEIAKLAEMRDQAITVIQSYEAHATHSLEELIVTGIHRMYAQAQDLAHGHLSDVVKHLSFLERLPMAGAIVGAIRHLLAA